MVADAKEQASKRERHAIPLQTRLKARNLYLTQGIALQEIADKCGLKYSQIRSLVAREKWAKSRDSVKTRLVANHDARVNEAVSEIVEAVASESEEIALAGLQRAREATESTSEFAAKDFQSWTGGVRNLVNIARQARGLDAERAPGQGATLNVFVGRYETVGAKQPTNVTGSAATDTTKAIDV